MFPVIALCMSLAVPIQHAPTVQQRESHTCILIAREIKRTYHVPFQDAYDIAYAAQRYGKRYNVPVEMILAITAIESSYIRNIGVSSAGAIGLMQIMPATGADIARELGEKTYDLNNLWTNMRFGTYYLSKLHKQFQDWSIVIPAFNTGAHNMTKILAGKAHYYPETRDYKVKASMAIQTIQHTMPYIILAEL